MKPKIRINNRLKGSWGETTTAPGRRPVIEINIRKHRTDKFKKRYTLKEAIADTLVHETMHAKRPRMHEKTVYRNTAKVMRKMSEKQLKKVLEQLPQH